MKIIRSAVVLLAVCFAATQVNGQKIKTKEGDDNILKNETSVNIEFTYDNMSVGKYDKEEDYIKNKTAEYNSKDPGNGDRWAKSWVSDRKGRFEPRFLSSFEDATGMAIKSDAKYTLIFHTTSTEPGYNVYISRKNAEIDAEVWIVETANRDKKLAVITVSNAPGRIFGGYDYDTGTRIMECYAVAGKRLGKYLK